MSFRLDHVKRASCAFRLLDGQRMMAVESLTGFRATTRI